MPITLPSHRHPLDLLEDEVACCQGCSELIQGPSYGCCNCSYFLHLACVEIRSPLHLEHTLTPGHLECHCQVCGDEVQFAFHCYSCGFHQCHACLPVAPTARIEREGHPFFLIWLENIDNLIRCVVCDKDKIIGSYLIFKCMFPGCRDFFHVHCVPFDLPQTIDSSCHQLHSVIFTEKHVHPGSTGWYCDYYLCEKARDPESPVYRCEECDQDFHIACALSEQLPDLIKKWETRARGQTGNLVKTPSAEAVANELKEKIANLRMKSNDLTRELENTVEELNKVEMDRAAFVLAAIMESMRKSISKL